MKLVDFTALIEENIAVKQLMLQEQSFMEALQQSATVLVEAYRAHRKVLLCGNGGSAADAQHIAAELTGRFYKDRPPLDAEALHVNTSYLTAVANDYGFDEVFSRLVAARGQEGDVLIAISTSGNSPNVLQAVKVAKQKKMTVIALTGEKGGTLAREAACVLAVPSSDTPRIQEAHILIGHLWCGYIEQTLFGA